MNDGFNDNKNKNKRKLVRIDNVSQTTTPTARIDLQHPILVYIFPIYIFSVYLPVYIFLGRLEADKKKDMSFVNERFPKTLSEAKTYIKTLFIRRILGASLYPRTCNGSFRCRK